MRKPKAWFLERFICAWTLPCTYGRGRFGIAASIHHLDSLLEVSPVGYSVERKLALPPKNKRDKVFWGLSPNDPVRYGKLLYKEDAVQVWMEGEAPDAYEMLIDFIHIKNLDDFTRAFNRTFSKVPLQDEHPEWPAEIRQAIAARKVIAGMTSEQAFSVVGAPLKITTMEENGEKSKPGFRGRIGAFWLPKAIPPIRPQDFQCD